MKGVRKLLDRPSQLANAILVFMLDNRSIRDPLLAYNAFVQQDSRDFGMNKGEKGIRALEIINHVLSKSIEDLLILHDIELKHGELYSYGLTSDEIMARQYTH